MFCPVDRLSPGTVVLMEMEHKLHDLNSPISPRAWTFRVFRNVTYNQLPPPSDFA